MSVYVWRLPRPDRQMTIIVSHAEDLESAREKLRDAAGDIPECLDVAAIYAWVNEQQPVLDDSANDLALALCADLYV